jgi:hypothetical protein
MNQNKNENQFICNNSGTYWLHWAPYDPVIKHPPIRQTLGTGNIEEARARRDLFICDWNRKEAA